MERGLNHDEHQFVASGVLLAKEGLLPYLDYPYFHVPNLVFIYAALFNFTDHYFLAARLLSAVFGWLTLAVLFYLAYNLFSRYSHALRFLMASGATVLLLVNPSFQYTTGFAWNHDSSVLFSLLAF